MDSFQAIVLAFVQGLTEFLPVSSSGHLILLPQLLGWEDQGLAFDVMVHLGSLIAVLAYFRHDLVQICRDMLAGLRGAAPTEHSRLGWQVVLATIPVGLAGLFLGEEIESTLRNPYTVAWTMIVFAIVLWWVDKNNKQQRNLRALGWRDILIIGCAQVIALMPGVSRSGMTITAGLLMGLNRDAAARFSFLMAIPVIVLAGGYKTVQLAGAGDEIEWDIMLLGVVVSAGVAFACIHWFLGFIRRFSMTPFAVYLLLLAGFILFLY